MDCSGRVRLSVYGANSVGTQAADLHERSASVRSKTFLKKNPLHLAAPPGFHEAIDAEDYMAGLAEEIAQCMLEDNDEGWDQSNETFCKRPESTWASQVLLSSSPQSTLEGLSSWDFVCPSASSSSDMSSGVSSPPTPVEASLARKDEDDAFDLLYAELLRLKVEDELKVRQQQLLQLEQQQHYQLLLWKMRQRVQASHLISSESSEICRRAQSSAQFFQKVSSSANNAYNRSKLRSNQDFNQSLRKAQMNGLAPATVPNPWGAKDVSKQSQIGGSQTFSGSPHAGKALSMNGSGMRAVFLETPGARECGGTGVFLPRRAGSGHEAKRKPACSTVLLPSRVMQALNLKVEDTLSPSPSASNLRSRELSSNAFARVRNSAEKLDAGPAEEWPRRALVCPSLQEVAPDVCLPTEWTY